MNIIHFIAMGISLVAIVGPFNIELINRGIKGGIYPALCMGMGGIIANIFCLLIIYSGFSSWMQNQVTEILFFTVGAILLLFLGFMSLNPGLPNSQSSPALVSSFTAGFLLVFANPINFMAWYSTFSQASNSLFVENPPSAIFIYCFFIIAGGILWMINLTLAVYFIREKMNIRHRKLFSFIAGIMLLWFSSEYLRRIAEMTWNW
ncbi:threonine/homoserine/homoserine lactone efflux protein [Bacillus oleivorans]|uniref:Threonine/homoserine/homoserine lactone efflux protein n=1 Tax=Bacillus oleivorans TaxID=1448271 RepID=A0A285CR30_9BACI|nr:LysE family transporter [Bacillus oleivorans]SNX69875.1 threonine/homoserine/homoserine lactone efflux protein [Bacillus oleivorans]